MHTFILYLYIEKGSHNETKWGGLASLVKIITSNNEILRKSKIFWILLNVWHNHRKPAYHSCTFPILHTEALRKNIWYIQNQLAIQYIFCNCWFVIRNYSFYCSIMDLEIWYSSFQKLIFHFSRLLKREVCQMTACIYNFFIIPLERSWARDL
jgi:hypothetical protein